MDSLSIQIRKKDNKVVASASGEVTLVYSEAYEEGDQIVVTCDKDNAYLMIQLDDAMGYAFVYLKNHQMSFTIPFGGGSFAVPSSFTNRAIRQREA